MTILFVVFFFFSVFLFSHDGRATIPHLSYCQSPLFLISCRLYNQPTGPDGRGLYYSSWADAVKKMALREGFRGFYKVNKKLVSVRVSARLPGLTHSHSHTLSLSLSLCLSLSLPLSLYLCLHMAMPCAQLRLTRRV